MSAGLTVSRRILIVFMQRDTVRPHDGQGRIDARRHDECPNDSGECIAYLRLVGSDPSSKRINAVFKLPKVCDPEQIVQEATKLAQGINWSTEELSVLIHQGIRPRKKFHVYDAPLPRYGLSAIPIQDADDLKCPTHHCRVQ